MSKSFPATLHVLEPGDEGYDIGRRYMIEQLDPTGQHFFTKREDAIEFCEIHGMLLIQSEKMEELRKQFQ